MARTVANDRFSLFSDKLVGHLGEVLGRRAGLSTLSVEAHGHEICSSPTKISSSIANASLIGWLG